MSTPHSDAAATRDARATRATVRRRSSAAESRRLAPFLLACDESAIGELEAMIAALPLCASGRVFIEVPSAADIGLVDVPSRMTVTWLTRADRSGAPGSGRSCGRGEALARAVTAWADEMLCGAPVSEVWLGGDYRGVAPVFEHLVHDLGVDRAIVTAPAAFRL